jgi:2Fe-2S ferredoxin
MGHSLLQTALDNKIDIEGTCEGSMACSTCHVVIEPGWFGRLDEPREDEEDMLDLAFDLTRTSCLCCQIIITEALDSLTVKLLPPTHNLLLE